MSQMSEAVNNIDRPKTNDDMHAGNMNLKVREREKNQLHCITWYKHTIYPIYPGPCIHVPTLFIWFDLAIRNLQHFEFDLIRSAFCYYFDSMEDFFDFELITYYLG